MPALRATAAVVAPPSRPYQEDPGRLAFYRDLVEPFGVPVEEELLRAGTNISHCDLVDRLVAEPGLRGLSPDLVVVAQALPDLTPFTAISPYLDRELGGGSTNFGIHNQGLGAPFTALRTISAFQRAGRSRTAVLAVLEQTTLPSRFPLVYERQLVDSGVLLVLGTEGGPKLGEVETLPAGQDAAARVGELAGKGPEGTLVVLGPWFDYPHPAAHRYQVERGTYCTSVWLALARHWRSWRRTYATVLLCDTDPGSGASHLAVLRSEER